MSDQNKEKINQLLREAEEKLAEAQKLANEAGIVFYWSGPAYGMGGSYVSKEAAEQWGSSDAGWQASSYSC